MIVPPQLFKGSSEERKLLAIIALGKDKVDDGVFAPLVVDQTDSTVLHEEMEEVPICVENRMQSKAAATEEERALVQE